MKAIEYLYLGMLLIAVVMTYYAIKNYNATTDLIKNGIRTKAKVIELLRISSDDGYTYKPVFEYRDRSNNVITFNSDVSSSPPAYHVGDLVEIIYSKDSNMKKVISFWGLYRWTIILLCLASPLLIIGGGYLLYARG
ncbi:MAG: DUF3592 domain-containing protein [Bacteroidota bacterium]|nr:DUF3592 domain-containing protein [Bacteroidota bacterium]